MHRSFVPFVSFVAHIFPATNLGHKEPKDTKVPTQKEIAVELPVLVPAARRAVSWSPRV